MIDPNRDQTDSLSLDDLLKVLTVADNESLRDLVERFRLCTDGLNRQIAQLTAERDALKQQVLELNELNSTAITIADERSDALVYFNTKLQTLAGEIKDACHWSFSTSITEVTPNDTDSGEQAPHAP